ncbi:MAG: terminase small subunit [Ferruginibacter sp.]
MKHKENYPARQWNKDRPALNPLYPHLKIKEKMFQTPADLKEKIDKYFGDLKLNTKEVMSASGAIKNIADPLIPTIEDFGSYLGLSKQSLLNYTSAEGYEDYHDIMTMARDRILGMKTRGLVNGKGSTSGIIFDLVNNHGYKNKAEVESNNKNEHIIKVQYDGE